MLNLGIDYNCSFFENGLKEDCYKKIEITDILNKYILKDCSDLKIN